MKNEDPHIAALHELVLAHREHDRLKEELKHAAAHLAEMREIAKNEMMARKSTRITLLVGDEIASISLATMVWTNKKPDITMEDAIAALKKSEYAAIVKESFSTQTISALAREWVAEKEKDGYVVIDPNEVIPESLRDVFQSVAIVTPRVTKG